MSGETMTPGTRGPQVTARSWLVEGLVGCWRGLAFCGLMLAGTGPLWALVLLVAMARRQPGSRPDPARLLLALMLIGGSVLAVRWLAGVTRRLAAQWCGVPIARPYRPPPGGSDGAKIGFGQRLEWLLTDPATWRDLLWTIISACGAWVLAAAPAALVVFGLVGLAARSLAGGTTHQVAHAIPTASGHSAILGTGIAHPYIGFAPTAWAAIPLGLALAALGVWMAPRLLPLYCGIARTMLAPTPHAELSLRVRQLAQTRSDTIDTGAAEMRRIERDLHDGAQARLVAMGMALDAAGQLLDDNPAAARALLLEARDSSAKALAELRDLVRGVHPPVLADRGLADAVRALALDCPLRMQLAGGLAGRPPAPVESAAYFAVSELLANVSKHAGAGQVWIDIGHERGLLRISVTDDGRGGADPARGTGLPGIERRLAAFDGVLAISSPPGGPTMVNMEIPCTLSSPKISSC